MQEATSRCHKRGRDCHGWATAGGGRQRRTELREKSGPEVKSVQAWLAASARDTAGRRVATACRLLAISVRCPM